MDYTNIAKSFQLSCTLLVLTSCAATNKLIAGPATAIGNSTSSARIDSVAVLNMPKGLSSDERMSLEQEAMRGSGDSARQLANDYAFFGYHLDEAYYWYAIGAENGDRISMYQLWVLGKGRNGKWSEERRMYWLQKAAKNGEPYAIQALKKLEKVKEH